MLFSKQKIFSLILFAFLVSVFALPNFAQAGGLYNKGCKKPFDGLDKDAIRLQVNIPGISQSKTAYTLELQGASMKCVEKNIYYVTSIQQYISKFYKFFIGAIALSAIVMLMVGGFQYILAAGNQSRIGAAKSIMAGALGGLVLTLLSYTLLNTINPKIVSLQLTDMSPLESIERFSLSCEEIPKEQIKKISSDGKIFKLLGKSLAGDENIQVEAYVTKEETKCGFEYDIKDQREGTSCQGQRCLGLNEDKTCISGSCLDVVLAGEVENQGNIHINKMEIIAVCTNNGKTQGSNNWIELDKNTIKYGFSKKEHISFLEDPFIINCDEDKTKFLLLVEIDQSLAFDDWYAIGDNGCGSNTKPLKQKKKKGNITYTETDPFNFDWKKGFKDEGELFSFDKDKKVLEKNTTCKLTITKNEFPNR